MSCVNGGKYLIGNIGLKWRENRSLIRDITTADRVTRACQTRYQSAAGGRHTPSSRPDYPQITGIMGLSGVRRLSDRTEPTSSDEENVTV